MDFFWLCLWVLLIRFFCGVVSGATAIGGVMLSMPLLIALFGPGDAVLLSTIMSAVAAPQMAWLYRKYSTFRDIFSLVLGCVPGCLIGGVVLKFAPMNVLQLMICAMLLTFVGLQCMRRTETWKLPEAHWVGFLTGAACGFVSSSVAMAGAPLGIYVLLRHWDPDRARGNMSMFYLFTVGGSVLTQAGAGLYTSGLFKLAFFGIMGNAAGQFLGYRLGRRVDQEMFRWIVTVFLAVAAFVLLLRGSS